MAAEVEVAGSAVLVPEVAGSAVLLPAAASLNGTLARRSLPVILTQEVTQVDLHTCISTSVVGRSSQDCTCRTPL